MGVLGRASLAGNSGSWRQLRPQTAHCGLPWQRSCQLQQQKCHSCCSHVRCCLPVPALGQSPELVPAS
jgi:hypothetical protein